MSKTIQVGMSAQEYAVIKTAFAGENMSRFVREVLLKEAEKHLEEMDEVSVQIEDEDVRSFIEVLSKREVQHLMARGKSSIVHQVKVAIDEIDRIGKSKKTLRLQGKHGIHSLNQKKESLSAAQNFVKWVRKEFKINSLYKLKQEHYTAYLSYLERNGRSVGHRQNVETALRHLQKGMNLRSEKFGRENHIFVPEKRVTNWRERKAPTDRSYTREEYTKILKHLPSNSRDAVMLCRELGLRVRESVGIRVEHFHKNSDGSWKLCIKKGEGAGITKGGRFREVPIPSYFNHHLERMIQGKEKHEHLVPVKRDTVRRAVNEACRKSGIIQRERGTHGFRHAYARDRIQQLFTERGIIAQAPRMVERIMENRDKGRAADYGILASKDKELFSQIRDVMDQVHEEIGHGKGRWDLANVYMR